MVLSLFEYLKEKFFLDALIVKKQWFFEMI